MVSYKRRVFSVLIAVPPLRHRPTKDHGYGVRGGGLRARGMGRAVQVVRWLELEYAQLFNVDVVPRF